MDLWQAAIVVLWELPEGSSRTPGYIASEIRRRDLSHGRPTGATPHQTIRTIMREHGRGHFTNGWRGTYTLKDREFSRSVYESMKQVYPHLFPTAAVASTQATSGEEAYSSSSPARNVKSGKKAGLTISGRASAKTRSIKPPVMVDVSKLADQLIPEEVSRFFEGEKVRIYVNTYERDRKARERCIATQGYSCSVCEMNFEEEYGEIGVGFIHVHHLNPLAASDTARETNAEEDLRPVCPNCHAMLHRSSDGLVSIEALRELRKKAKRRKSRAAARKRRRRAT